MLHEDNPGHMAAATWQMQSENGNVGGEVSSRPLDFMARASRGHIGRQVCWPPKPEYSEDLPAEDSSNQVSMEVQQQALQQVNGQMQQQSMMNSSSSSSRQEPSDVGDRPKVAANGPTGPTVTTQFPAGFKMREQAPVQQTPPAMILSQPAFKISQPLKQKGENKWPPKGDNVVTQEQVREFTKPKGGKRDYGEFFAQNALPQTFCSYRAPPGTQHHGEETGVSEM